MAPFPRAQQPGRPDLENLTSDPCCAYSTKRSSHREETIAVVETLDRSTPPRSDHRGQSSSCAELEPLARIGKKHKSMTSYFFSHYVLSIKILIFREKFHLLYIKNKFYLFLLEALIILLLEKT